MDCVKIPRLAKKGTTQVKVTTDALGKTFSLADANLAEKFQVKKAYAGHPSVVCTANKVNMAVATLS